MINSTPKAILFRVDSSFEIGVGHIMRDLVLAKQYENTNIIFATLDLAGNINEKITQNGYRVHNLKSSNRDELLQCLSAYHIDLLVFDHYDVHYEYEKYIKEHSSVSILSFDDTYEKHYCDILLNHNIYAQKERYKGLVPDTCALRCGIEHTLLRDEFLDVSASQRKGNHHNTLKIFIAMGGADSKNMNINILESLNLSKVEIELVTTSANNNLERLEEYIQKFDNINLIVNSNNIASIVNDCDIAIVTPSVMVNEIIFLSLPFISVMVTENQRYMFDFLKDKGLPCVKKENIAMLNDYVEELIDKDVYNKNINIIKKLISKRDI